MTETTEQLARIADSLESLVEITREQMRLLWEQHRHMDKILGTDDTDDLYVS
jgi:hypothetical protein